MRALDLMVSENNAVTSGIGIDIWIRCSGHRNCCKEGCRQTRREETAHSYSFGANPSWVIRQLSSANLTAKTTSVTSAFDFRSGAAFVVR